MKSWNLNVSQTEFAEQLVTIEKELSLLQMERTRLFTYNNARNVNLTAPLYYLITLVSKVFMFSTLATLFFVQCCDKTTELARHQAQVKLTHVTGNTEVIVEPNGNMTNPLDIDYVNERVQNEEIQRDLH